MKARLPDRCADPHRRSRARDAARSLTGDPVLQEAAERVFFLVEKMSGIRPEELDLDVDIASLVAGEVTDEWVWDCLEQAAGIPLYREHAIANLRRGSVRHFMQHLCVCRVCRARLQSSSSPGPKEG